MKKHTVFLFVACLSFFAFLSCEEVTINTEGIVDTVDTENVESTVDTENIEEVRNIVKNEGTSVQESKVITMLGTCLPAKNEVTDSNMGTVKVKRKGSDSVTLVWKDKAHHSEGEVSHYTVMVYDATLEEKSKRTTFFFKYVLNSIGKDRRCLVTFDNLRENTFYTFTIWTMSGYTSLNREDTDVKTNKEQETPKPIGEAGISYGSSSKQLGMRTRMVAFMDMVNGVEEYSVYRKKNEGKAKLIHTGKTNTFTDENLGKGVYTFSVSVSKKNSTEDTANKREYLKTLEVGGLDSPQNVKAVMMGEAVTLLWDKVEGATEYIVLRGNVYLGSTKDTAYTIRTKQSKRETYVFKVRAFAVNNETNVYKISGKTGVKVKNVNKR